MATFTSGNRRFTACAITCEVEWRSVGKGSGRQSNSPAMLRCRASSSASAMLSLSQKTREHHRAAPSDARNSLAHFARDRLTMRTPR